jgi:protocatechuate 3,4-dioxygenase alpha subunit
VRLSCRVFDGEGLPVTDALIEIWQADAEGRYHPPGDANGSAADPACGGFGRLPIDESGACEFETIKPGRVAGPGNTLQAPHLVAAVFARGLLGQLYTRIYFADDPANTEDPVLALVPQARRETLMARPDPASHPANQGRWFFDIHLQGDHETVFFDV